MGDLVPQRSDAPASIDPVLHCPHPAGIVYRDPAELKPNPTNPRRHDPRQRRRMTALMRKFGFRIPILADSTDTLITGHLRVEIAIKLGIRAVPTILVDDLSPAEIRALMIADNKISDMASWDDAALRAQFIEIAEIEPDFDLELTGFDMGEIDLRMQVGDTKTTSPERADDISANVQGPPVTKPGDHWVLGRHHVVCGSSLDDATHSALLGNQVAAMVFTDPPYNVAIDGHATGLGTTKHREFAMASGEMSRAEFESFLGQACTPLTRHARKGALVYFCMDWRHIGEILVAGSAAFGPLINLCVWAKDAAGMGSLYRSQHELVFVFRNGGAAHRNNVQLGRFGRNRSNLWSYPSPSAFGRSGEEGKLLALHPTVKPVNMVADAIMDCTTRRDIVLDPFLGSGTTIIAAERTGRRCYGIELDPAYVDVIVRRWQAHTRHQAVLAGVDRTFDEIGAEREGQRHE